ncbi:MAG: hypothetical protein ACR2PF_03475, partial [Rhizobiaceae bacterium]
MMNISNPALPPSNYQPDTAKFELYLEKYFTDIYTFAKKHIHRVHFGPSDARPEGENPKLACFITAQNNRLSHEVILGRLTKQWPTDILLRLDNYASALEQATGRSIKRLSSSQLRPDVPNWNDPLALVRATVQLVDLADQTPSFADGNRSREFLDCVYRNFAAPDPTRTANLIREFGAYAGPLQVHYARTHGISPNWTDTLSPNLHKALLKNLDIDVVCMSSRVAPQADKAACSATGILLNVGNMGLLLANDRRASKILEDDPIIQSVLAGLNRLRSTPQGLEQLYLLCT